MRRRFGFAVWRCWELRDNVKHLNYIRMKRVLISIMALVALCFTAAAQQKGLPILPAVLQIPDVCLHI